MTKYFSTGIVIALVLTLSACSGNEQESAKKEKAATPPETAHTTPAAPAAPAKGAALHGKVLESMQSGGYTYLQIDTGSTTPWIAIPESKVTVGTEVSCAPGMTMKNFSSKTLNRTFDSIIFSAGLLGDAPTHGMTGATIGDMPNPHGKSGAAAPADDSFASAVKAEGGNPMMQQPMKESGGSLGAIAPFSEVSVEKAAGENAYTVEEIFSKTAELNGKTIRIQGKVVKYSPMIMGRNWVHLQDGTGSPMSNSHDLVVTTAETFAVDDIVTVEGILTADKDFGAGYKYTAIIEQAKAVK